MVKINRIYTRTGDDGSTGLVGGSRVPKTSIRVNAYGDIDELNSWLGYTISTFVSPKLVHAAEVLKIVQNELFDIGSELAAPAGYDLNSLPVIENTQVQQLERWIDSFSSGLPELLSFILPGGDLTTSSLHIARTVARRAERGVLMLHLEEPVREVMLKYLNRLSDLLFCLARYSSWQLGIDEVLWVPAASRTNC